MTEFTIQITVSEIRMGIDLQDGKIGILLQVRPDRCLGNGMFSTQGDDELFPGKKHLDGPVDQVQGPPMNGLSEA